MSFPRYPKYKPSGVEWLGDVPEHWEVVQLKQFLDIQNGADHKQVEQTEGYPVIGSGGPFTYASDFLYEGESVLLGRKGTIDKPLHFIGRFWTVDTMYWAKIRPQASGRFSYYTALTIPFEYYSTNTALPSMTKVCLNSHFVARPSLAEQQCIAAFLDRETGKIDALVAEQRRLMALLKEKRQAVISHAVTRGLNPQAPLKPSGIEWLGDVPTHWEVKPIRMIANVVRGASPRPAGDPRFFGGNEVPWVTVAEITKDNEVYLTGTESFLTQEGAAHSNLFRSGTLIYSNSGATLGVPKILRIDACANDGVVAFLNLSSEVCSEFLYHYLASITGYIRDKVKQGSGQPNLNTDIVKDLRFGLPPMDEQEAIVRRITELAEQFDTLTAEAQRAIDLLQERRTALISAAVTGQIDVRETT